MSEQVDKYLNAMEAFSKAKSRIEDLNSTAKGYADWDWKTIHVQVGQTIRPDVGSLPSGRGKIDGAKWPTADQIADAINTYHVTRLALRSAYESVDQRTRAVLTPPTA